MSPLLAAAAETTGTGEAVVFWVLAPVAVISSLSLLVVRKAVHSALMLAVTMLCLAVFYVVQDAPFLGVVQVVVYTGAVMMLFLFVLMLVGVDSGDSLIETLRGQRIAAVLAGVGFAALLFFSLGGVAVGNRGLERANADGNVPALADLIFSRYVVAFELTSALLITAALGAMVLTHRESIERKVLQRELSVERFRSGSFPGTLPGPGVYARHNAVDTPALLPDGSPAATSVSRVLAARGDVRPPASRAEPIAAVERGRPTNDPVNDEPPGDNSSGGTAP